MSTKKCAACNKTMLMMDPSISAEGGFYHKECFKCTHCKGQLTLLNFAQIKGVLYCKPHYMEIFSRRGKYDDIPTTDKKEGTPSSTTTPAVTTTESTSTPAVVVETPAPAPEPVPAPVVAAEPVTVAAEEPAPAPAPEPVAVVPEPVVAVVAKEPAPAPAPEPAPVVVVEPVVTPVVVEPEPTPVPAPAPTPAPVVAETKPAPAPAPVKVAPSPSTTTTATEKPKFGGSSTKCTVCTKTVYPADPQYSSDGLTWHRECFKCVNCKGQLSLSTWAQIEGKLFDKACFFKLFGARGKYDDVLKAVAEKEAADKGITLNDGNSTPTSSSSTTTTAEVTSPTPAVVEPEPTPVPAPAPAPVKVAPSPSTTTTATEKPKFGGSSTKCTVCTKTVYPADPQYSSDGLTWHRECFKCVNCKGQLSLSTWAQIEGKLFDKACFFKLFGARGKYDDVLKAVAEKEAADKATESSSTNASN